LIVLTGRVHAYPFDKLAASILDGRPATDARSLEKLDRWLLSVRVPTPRACAADVRPVEKLNRWMRRVSVPTLRARAAAVRPVEKLNR
jgi:hypothetical protein